MSAFAEQAGYCCDFALSSYQSQEVSAVFSVPGAARDKSLNYFRLLSFHVTC